MAGGRPTDFKPEYCERLVAHMKEGYSYETFAATIGLCRASLYVWEKSHPEFLDAKKRGFEVCQFEWEKIGKKGLFAEKGDPVLNTGMWIFNMKNRFKWTDRVEVTPLPPSATNPLMEASDDELDRLLEGE